MAVDNSPSRLRGSYAVKFGVGGLALLVIVGLAIAKTYTHLAPQLTAAQTNELLSGFLVVIGSMAIWIAYLMTTVGRESLFSVRTLVNRAQQMERGDLDVEFQVNKDDELGDLNRSFAAMRDALKARLRETEERNRALQARAEEYSRVMEAAADGDLTVRMNPDEDIQSMNEIATSFNAMMDDLEGTIVEVQSFATEVSGATDELAQQASQSQQAAQAIVQVAEAIESEEQQAVEMPALENGDAPEDAEVNSEVLEGVDELTHLDGEYEQTLASMAQLNARMEQVDDVGEFISDIASETNMLALNASIEASKVESGAEGFEVVAEEIKSLAEETKTSADEIESIMDGVRGGTTDTIDDVVRQQVSALESIGGQAGDLARTSSELREALQDLSVSTRTDAGEADVVAGVDEDNVIEMNRSVSTD